MANRCRHDIIASVLKATIEGPSKLSHLALKSNLPYDRARPIVEDLVKHGLLSYNPVSRTYTPTELAYQWLAIYLELGNIYDKNKFLG
ncbi:MAG: hypothetical protein F7B59_06770 [Desulfurococcales archaeon]|nr:hypothetical protein [Desulfurococcales archaeon]